MKSNKANNLIIVILALAWIVSTPALVVVALTSFGWTHSEQHVRSEFRGAILAAEQPHVCVFCADCNICIICEACQCSSTQTPYPPISPPYPQIPVQPTDNVNPPEAGEEIEEMQPEKPEKPEEPEEPESEEDDEIILTTIPPDTMVPETESLQDADTTQYAQSSDFSASEEQSQLQSSTQAEPGDGQEQTPAQGQISEHDTSGGYVEQISAPDNAQDVTLPERTAIPLLSASGFFSQVSEPIRGDSNAANGIVAQLITNGIPALTIGGEQIPLLAGGFGNQVWVLANFILSIAGLILMGIMLMRLGLFKKRKGSFGSANKHSPVLIKIGLIFPMIAKLLFLITQDMRLPVVIFDWWTLVHAAVLVLMSLCYISMFRKRNGDSSPQMAESAQC
ncbi:MAG: hypothetical protein FWC66_05270 [Oscillospiraceae bacterium]|nr:hypothetical protein [Oscillospiraceae bacterium]